MQLAQQVKTFSYAREKLISSIAVYRPLTKDEAMMIEHYCMEVLAKIAPFLPTQE